MKDDFDEVDRLADAIDAFLDHDPTDREHRAEFLEAHEDVREFLEPMLDDPTDDEEECARIQRLGPYRILSELGRGGMGIVYAAEHADLGRRVALKILPGVFAASPTRIERLRREARAVASLDHPGVVRVFDVGEHEGTWFLAMELVEGETLRDAFEAVRVRCQRDPRRLPAGPQLGIARAESYVDEVVELGRLVAEALAHAHERGLVHRDVKPQNILVDRAGRPKLLDFGLVKHLEDDGISLTGEFAGTPHYAAPEQIEPRPRGLDARADVFALGVVLYELLAMRRPFEAASSTGVLRAILTAEPRSLRALAPDVSLDLETIVMRCLEKSPERRYESAAELGEDLRRLQQGDAIRARRPGSVRRALRWAHRHRAAASVLTLSFLLFVVVPILGWIGSNHARREVERERDAAREARLHADRKQRLADLRSRQAWRGVELFVSRLTDREHETADAFSKFRKGMLDDARDLYRELIANLDQDESPIDEIAFAHLQLGRASNLLGYHAEALPPLDRAIETLVPRRADGSMNLRARQALASAFTERGQARHLLGDGPGCADDFGAAMDSWTALADDVTVPDMERRRAWHQVIRVQTLWAEFDLSDSSPRLLERLRATENALRELEQREPENVLLDLDRAQLHLLRAEESLVRGDLDAVRVELDEVREFLSRRAVVTRSRGRYLEARGLMVAARWQEAAGRHDQALRAWSRALERWKEREASLAENLGARLQAVSCRDGLASAALQGGRYALARDTANEALEELERIFSAQPLHVGAHRLNASLLAHRATAMAHQDESEEAVTEAFEKALAARRRLIETFPQQPGILSALGGILNNQAWWLLTRKTAPDPAGARTLLEEALVWQKRAVELAPRMRVAQAYLTKHLSLLAECLLRMREFEAASARLLEVADRSRDDATRLVDVAYGQLVVARAARVGSVAALGIERCLDALELALELEPARRSEVAVDERFRPLARTERFLTLVAEDERREEKR